MAKANVVKKEESQLPALSLDLMEGDAHSGLENISQDDLATPRLKVLMQLSPELEELEGAKAGMIFNTVTSDLYDGSNGIRVLPCAYQRQYVEWADRGQGSGAPINVYDASSDILTKTTRDDNNKDRLENGNYVEDTGNHFVYILDENYNPIEQALITMKSTQKKKSKTWNSMIMSRRAQGKSGMFNPPSWSTAYKLSTTKESNSQNSWYGWVVEFDKFLNTQEHLKALETTQAFYQSAMKSDIFGKVDFAQENQAQGNNSPDKAGVPF